MLSNNKENKQGVKEPQRGKDYEINQKAIIKFSANIRCGNM